MIAQTNTSPAHSGPADAVLVVDLGDRAYGLPLAAVERVLPMAQVMSLPDSDQGMLGVLNLHGDVLPVVDPRPRLGLPTPALSPEHRLVLVREGGRFLLWVDGVQDVVAEAHEALSVGGAERANALITRILRLGDAMVPMLAPAALAPRGVAR